MSTIRKAVALGCGLAAFAASAAFSDETSKAASRHVLLVSIDGMHALDLHNCRIANTCPNLAALTAAPAAGS